MTSVRKIIASASVLALGLGALAGCGSDNAGTSDSEGKVYMLNSKPEVVDQLQELADAYTDETGVQVDVQTASSGTYDTTLLSELAKDNAPTMFSTAGYATFARYKKYLEPIQDSEVYGLLNDDAKANSQKIGDDSYTIPYAVEYYGIIYNKKIVNEYAKKSYAVIKSADDITGYDVLKKVVEDMNKHKDDLGIQAAFATPGLESSDTYRFAAHMTRPPIFFEYRDNNTTFMKEIKGTYLDNYKDLFDLEMNNSPTERTMLGSKNYVDCTSEFALGDVAFYPNGVWAYSQIKDNEVADEDLGMLPYWMGVDGEEDYGPSTVYEATWGINKNASKADRQASLDFIKWMVTSDKGKEIMSKDMGFAVPFTTFGDDDQPDNPLVKAAKSWEDKGKKYMRSVDVPDQNWQNGIANALLEYAQGTGEWDGVKSAIVDGWKSEWAASEKSQGMLPEQTDFTW